MNSALLVLLGILGWTAWGAGRWAHRVALSSPAKRTLLLWGGLLAIPLGVYVVLFFPEQIDFNRESPGGIFYVYLPCLIVGGTLFAGGIGSFVGALRVRA